MTTDYNVTVELDAQADAEALDLPESLVTAHRGEHGGLAATVTVGAEDPLTAASIGYHLVLGAVPDGVLPVGVHTVTTAEFDRRAGLDADQWVSVPQAATDLGISQQRVRQLLDEGKLTGQKVGRDWNVSAQSVQDRIAALV